MNHATEAARATVITQLATWVSSSSIEVPQEVSERARLAILDTIGTTVGASISPDFDVVSAFIGPEAGAEHSPLIGRGGSATPADAALINSFTAHLLDFDDSHGDMAGHPTAVVVPALLALAPGAKATMQELVTAYVVGVEVISRLGRMLNPDHYDIGWHPTATIGVFGAAAAAARLLRFDAQQTEACLSLAAAFASGIKASFGTTAKPLQVGRSAASAVQAAQLAAAHATGRPDAFEHPQGFIRVFERKDPQAVATELDVASLGSEWSLMTPGIIIKQYPCCGSTHSAIESASALSPIKQEDIESVFIELHPKRRGHVDRPQPDTPLEAKFSVQYTVSSALMNGTVKLSDFTAEALNGSDIQAMLAKTTVADIDADDTSVEDRYVAQVTVKLTDGNTVQQFTPVASGRAPGEMLAAERIVAKFTNCVRGRISDANIEALIDIVLQGVDQQATDVLPLTR